MASPSNHWKLGLFVVCGVTLGFAALVLFSARSLRTETVQYKSYFDESVQGLEVGSPVKFRGVTIGRVSAIDVGPDRRHVAVTSELGVDEINIMGIGTGKGKKLAIKVPPDLRVQIASAGITGVKFVTLDFFPIKSNPPPDLPFPVSVNYIPAAVSTMKNLEDAVIHAVDRFPDMTDAAMKMMDKLNQLLIDVDDRHLPAHAASVLAKADAALSTVQGVVAKLDTGRIGAQAEKTLLELDGTAMRMNRILDRIDGDKGMVMSAQRASDAVGDAALSARGLGEDLSTTLRDFQLLTESLLKLTDALERDSDMLVKGRAKGAR
jgi:phospholipid/cholesterol/gamma-HCH transport system substrate-binding protein